MQARRMPALSMMIVSAALMGTSVQAQDGEFAGQFVFQTSDLRPGPDFEILSGYADAERLPDGTYDLFLFAVNYIQDARGQRRFYAAQRCTGQFQGLDMRITCTVEQTTGQNYTPDNFVLRQDPDGRDRWAGTYGLGGSVYAEFVDLD
jgi:hypothetical protein